MVIEPTSNANATLQSRTEKEVTPDAVKGTNVNNEGISEAGQTSEIGPAVVPNISAATLETSRAVSAPEQSAGQAKADDIIDARDKEQLQKSAANAPKGPAPSGKSIVDTSV